MVNNNHRHYIFRIICIRNLLRVQIKWRNTRSYLAPSHGHQLRKHRCGCRQGSYKKLNLKFKNIQEHFWGKTNLFKNISGASSAHFIYNTINRAISSGETKSLTEVGAVKHVNNGYYRKNRHSVLLRGMLFNQEMNVQR